MSSLPARTGIPRWALVLGLTPVQYLVVDDLRAHHDIANIVLAAVNLLFWLANWWCWYLEAEA